MKKFINRLFKHKSEESDQLQLTQVLTVYKTADVTEAVAVKVNEDQLSSFDEFVKVVVALDRVCQELTGESVLHSYVEFSLSSTCDRNENDQTDRVNPPSNRVKVKKATKKSSSKKTASKTSKKVTTKKTTKQSSK